MKRIVTIVLCALLSGCKTGNADYGAALALVGYGLMWSGISQCLRWLLRPLHRPGRLQRRERPLRAGRLRPRVRSGGATATSTPRPRSACRTRCLRDLVQQPPPPDPLPDFIVPPKRPASSSPRWSSRAA